MRLFRILCVLFALCFLASNSTRAQDDPNFETGLKPFGSYHMGNIDTVNLGNGSLMVHIPLVSYPQRGGKTKFEISLDYFSMSAYADYMCVPPPINQCYIMPGGSAGGPYGLATFGIIYNNEIQLTQQSAQGTYPALIQITDATGATHVLGATGTNLLESVDATGWHGTANASGNVTSVTGSDGTVYDLTACTTGCVQDTNGNKTTYSSTSQTWTDTMGRAIPQLLSSTNPSDFTNCTGSQPVSYVWIWNLPGPNGGTYPLKLCWESTPGLAGIESVVLPDLTTWTFEYAQVHTGIYPGLVGENNPEMMATELYRVTFPTGGMLSYGWNTIVPRCATHTFIADVGVLGRILNPNDGITPPSTWGYSYPGGSTPSTVVSAPPSSGPVPDDTVHTFGFGGCHLYETQTQSYQGSQSGGALLKTVTTNYSYTSLGWVPTPGLWANVLATSVQTAWANGQTNTISYTYDSGFQFQAVAWTSGNPIHGSGTVYTGTFGKVLTKSEYDYGNGAPGSLMRTTTNTYLALTNSTYKTYNIIDPISSVQIKDGGGTQRAYTTYSYDGSSLISSGITTQHVTPPNGTYRGNLTSVARWLNTTGAYLTSTNTYFDTGMVNVAKDPKLNPTTYAYSSTYVGAYPTTITNALNQSATSTYDFNTGLLNSTTDPNNQTTSYQYDQMLRTTEIDRPDGGQTLFSYPTPNEVDISEKMDTLGNFKTASLLVDGLGRKIRQIVSNGESLPYDQADTSYDGSGRPSFKSYPYQGNGFSAARVTSGAGDSFAYDALGRAKTVTHSDSSTVLTSYTGRATSVQDEGNGTQRVQRISQVDGLGRLKSVCEVTNTTLTVGITGSTTPAACSLDIAATGFLTTYSYDTLDNLTSVAQGPLNARTFAYDSLSRLTSAANPESGTTLYTYDADSNVLTKRDARNITITYAYDALNRLTGKTYSDTTPAATYSYDQSSALGVTLTNTIGRKSYESTAGTNPTASVFSYDPMGRVLNNSQCTPQNCAGTPFSLAYTYDLLGDVTSSTNGAGVTLTNAYNTGARLTSLTSSLSDSNHPGTLFSAGHFNAAGSLLSASLGNGVNETRTYDGRLRLNTISDGSLYTLTIPTSNGYAPNGDILAANDSVNGNWTYGYDAFNRLTAASATGQAYTYAYDRFGNRWQQNGPHPSLPPGFGANNRIVSGSGVAYDAAGDTTNDGSTAYTYDAEGRIITAVNGSSGTSTYVYDAEGRRVRKTTVAGGSVDFLYDLGGAQIAQITSTGSWTRGEVYAGGHHLATYSGGTGGNTYFIHADWLGTERARTTASGAPYETCTSLPFGDWLTCSGGDPSPMHFTGKERDTESGLDYFEARHYGSSLGRFMQPDPMGGHLTDPQTLNRYTYVRNNPLSLTDPTGLDFALSCTQTKDNASTCQSQQVGTDKNGNAVNAFVQGTTDSNGKFTSTQIGDDGKGGLVDKTTGTGAYTADVTGSGVQFSQDGGKNSSGGVFVNGTDPTHIQGSGDLSGFSFTFTNSKLEANQTAAGTFTFSGTEYQAGKALMNAGFVSMGWFGKNKGFDEFRSTGSGAFGENSAHFNIGQVERTPSSTVPSSTKGNMHFGEHSPLSLGVIDHILESNK